MFEELLLSRTCEGLCSFLLELRDGCRDAHCATSNDCLQERINASRTKWLVQRKCLEAHRAAIVEDEVCAKDSCGWFQQFVDIGETAAFRHYKRVLKEDASAQSPDELEHLCDTLLLRGIRLFWDALIVIRERSETVCRRLFAENVLEQARAQNLITVLEAYAQHLKIINDMSPTEAITTFKRRLTAVIASLHRLHKEKVNALIDRTSVTAQIDNRNTGGDAIDPITGSPDFVRLSDYEDSKYVIFDYELCFFATGPSYRLLLAAYRLCQSLAPLLWTSTSCTIGRLVESVESLIMLNAHLQVKLRRMEVTMNRRKKNALVSLRCGRESSDLVKGGDQQGEEEWDKLTKKASSSSEMPFSPTSSQDQTSSFFDGHSKILSVASAFLRAYDWMANTAQMGSLVLEALHKYSNDHNVESLSIDWPTEFRERPSSHDENRPMSSEPQTGSHVQVARVPSMVDDRLNDENDGVVEVDENLQIEFFMVSSLAFSICHSLACMAIQELEEVSARLPGREKFRRRLRRKLYSWSSTNSEDMGALLVLEDAAQVFCKWLPVLSCNLHVLNFATLPNFYGVPTFADIETGTLALGQLKRARATCLDTLIKLIDVYPSTPLPYAYIHFITKASLDTIPPSESIIRSLAQQGLLIKILLRNLCQRDHIFTTLGSKITL